MHSSPFLTRLSTTTTFVGRDLGGGDMGGRQRFVLIYAARRCHRRRQRNGTHRTHQLTRVDMNSHTRTRSGVCTIIQGGANCRFIFLSIQSALIRLKLLQLLQFCLIACLIDSSISISSVSVFFLAGHHWLDRWLDGYTTRPALAACLIPSYRPYFPTYLPTYLPTKYVLIYIKNPGPIR